MSKFKVGTVVGNVEFQTLEIGKVVRKTLEAVNLVDADVAIVGVFQTTEGSIAGRSRVRIRECASKSDVHAQLGRAASAANALYLISQKITHWPA